tara:strand:+ start:2038 stop:2847 length:810 start_codon:yes stop_codon:yes gene_type:complete
MYDYFPELDGPQSEDNGKLGRKLFKGGGGGQTQTQTQSIDPMLKPYITKGLDEASRLYDAGAPDYFPGSTVVGPSSQTTAGLAAQQAAAMGASPLIGAAQGQALSTIQGDRLSAGNPYFADMMRSAAAPAIDEFNTAIGDIGSRASMAGRYGSGAMFNMEDAARDNLANALTSTAADLSYTNFANERAAQDAAINAAGTTFGLGMLPGQALTGVGSTLEGYDRQALQADIDRYQYGANAPANQLNQFLSAAYGAPTPMSTTTTSSGGGK